MVALNIRFLFTHILGDHRIYFGDIGPMSCDTVGDRFRLVQFLFGLAERYPGALMQFLLGYDLFLA